MSAVKGAAILLGAHFAVCVVGNVALVYARKSSPQNPHSFQKGLARGVLMGLTPMIGVFALVSDAFEVALGHQ